MQDATGLETISGSRSAASLFLSKSKCGLFLSSLIQLKSSDDRDIDDLYAFYLVAKYSRIHH